MIDQFTRQADGFSTAAAMNEPAALDALLRAVDAAATDVALDVACGPGITTAALANRVHHVTGIDVSPAMIALAERRCADKGLPNAAFEVTDVTALPVHDGSATVVVCRYALHHVTDPERVVAEMARVCAPGGRVAVADIAADPDPAVAVRFDDVERARDPSHVRALTGAGIAELLARQGLDVTDGGSYRVPVRLGPLLARSASPDPDRVRRLFAAAVAGEPLGVRERHHGDDIAFEYRITIRVGRKATEEGS